MIIFNMFGISFFFSSFPHFDVSSTRFLVVVVTESSISSRCQDGQPHTQVFSLFLWKKKRTGQFLFIFLFVLGMEWRRGGFEG